MKFKAGKASELGESCPKAVKIAPNFQILLVKREGRIFAINDECPHMGGSLSEGELDNNEIICPLHFWRFDIESGNCTEGGSESVANYPVEVVDDEIIISIPL